MSVDEFVETHLTDQLTVVQRGGYAYTEWLSVYDQAVIYAYSSAYYLPLNRYLRTGVDTPANVEFLTNFSQLLTESLEKQPICKALVYRGVQLSTTELAIYHEAVKKGETIVEPFFVSTSKSKNTADKYGRVLFRIINKRGRDISTFSRHAGEAEILLMHSTSFDVLSVKAQHDGRVVIMLEEV